MRTKQLLILITVLALSLTGLGIVTAQDEDEGTAWLGVAVYDEDAGVTIGDVVADSPAADAGLKVGDVILAVDDTEIATGDDLVEVIQSHSPGDTVTLTIESDGESSEVPVTLRERPDDLDIPDEPEFIPNVGIHGMLNFLGLEAELTDDGLLINSIDADSPLVDSDLQEGDLITAIDGEPVDDLAPGALMRGLMSDETITLTVERDGEEIDVELDLSALAEGFDIMPVQPGMGSGMMMGRPTQLGVRFATMSPDVAEEQGIEMQEGALVVEVYEDTPAAEAGLLADDIITAVDGDPVDEEHILTDRLYAYEEGDVVTLSVSRGGEDMEISVTLGPLFYGHDGMFGFGPGGRFHFGPGDMEGFEGFFNMPPFTSPDEVPAPEVPTGDDTSA